MNVFNLINKYKLWMNRESRSGPGSTMKHTAHLRAELPLLLKRYKIGTMLDLPCGDFYWMKRVELNGTHYIGADIVKDLIQENKKYENGERSFKVLDVVNDTLPEVDLIMVRDCLIHLSNHDVQQALDNIRSSGITYLLTTSHTRIQHNKHIPTGAWRKINLELAPFSLPPPVEAIHEEKVFIQDTDKTLALWRVADLPTQHNGTKVDLNGLSQ